MRFLVIEVTLKIMVRETQHLRGGLLMEIQLTLKQPGFVLCESSYQWISVNMEKYMCRIMCTLVQDLD